VARRLSELLGKRLTMADDFVVESAKALVKE
jgi:hypothetical protein